MSDTFEPPVDQEGADEDEQERQDEIQEDTTSMEEKLEAPNGPVADEQTKNDWDEDAPKKAVDLDDGAGDYPRE